MRAGVPIARSKGARPRRGLGPPGFITRTSLARLISIGGVVALGLSAELVAYGPQDPARWLPDLAVGWSLLASGVVANRWRPTSRAGFLLGAAGAAWFAGNFGVPGGLGGDLHPLALVATQLTFLHRAVLMHVALTLPTGRLPRRWMVLPIALGYVTWLFPATVGEVPIVTAIGVVFLGAAAASWWVAPAPVRRSRIVALLTATLLSATYAGAAAAHLAVPSGRLDWLVLLLDEAAVIAAGLLAVYAVALPRFGADHLTDLVVELREPRTGSVRDALAAAIGDPTLEVGYWHGPSDAYLDAAGLPIGALTASAHDPRRVVTSVDIDGRRAAMLVHDPSTLEEAALRESVRTMTRLAAANARLRGDVLDRLTQVRASRRRLLAASDAERRRLERRLTEGALRRAEALADALAAGDPAEDPLGRARGLVESALTDLRALARGLHPRVLDEAGLEVAIHSLAAGSPIPVRLDIDTGDERLPEGVVLATYYLCSEGLANAAKHSQARRVGVSVRRRWDSLAVEVSDDGVGGAAVEGGAGLRGIADRIEAIGGRFDLRSDPGAGTTLAAQLSLEMQPGLFSVGRPPGSAG